MKTLLQSLIQKLILDQIIELNILPEMLPMSFSI